MYAVPVENKDRQRNETFIYRSPLNLDRELGFRSRNRTVLDLLRQ